MRIASEVQKAKISPAACRKKQIATPTVESSAPAIAGPSVRVRLLPAELSPTALARSSRGTVFGTSVCRTGKVSAIVQPSRKVSVRTDQIAARPVGQPSGRAAVAGQTFSTGAVYQARHGDRPGRPCERRRVG